MAWWARLARTAWPMAAATAIQGTTARSDQPLFACRLNARWPMTSTPMTAAVPAMAGVLSLRSENTNSDTTSAGPMQGITRSGGHRCDRPGGGHRHR